MKKTFIDQTCELHKTYTNVHSFKLHSFIAIPEEDFSNEVETIGISLFHFAGDFS